MAESVKTPPPDTTATEPVRSIWLGFAEIRRPTGGKRRIHIRWLRLAAALIGGGVIAWLLLALLLYFFFKIYRGFEDERYTDTLFWVFHMKEHNHKMGEYYLREAKLDYQRQQWAEAMQNYRLGLMKAPENLEARLMLSEFYAAYYKDQISRSLDLLEAGLPYAENNPEYVSAYLMRLQQNHFPDKAIEVSRAYLAKDLKNPRVRYVFASSLTSVLIEQGRYDEAEEVIAKYKLTDQLDGTLLNAQLLWESGRHRAAIQFLEASLKRAPGNQYIYTFLARYYRDIGDLDRARQYIVLRAINAPNNADPLVELLYIYAKSGDKQKVAVESQKIINQFRGDESAMIQLANYATNQGDIPLARQVFEIASANPKFNIAPFCILVIEAFLTDKEYDNALMFIDQIERQKPPWYLQFKQVIDSLRAVADYGNGHSDMADLFLTTLLKDNRARPDVMREIANRFYTLGGLAQAQRLLEAAYNQDPHSQAILTQLITVDLQLGSSAELSDNLRSLLKMRRPPLELLLDAYRMLGSDRFIFVTDREHLLDELDTYIRSAAAKRVVEE